MTPPPNRPREALYPLALLAVAGLVLWQAGKLAPAPFDPLGPKTFPIWIAWALVALALAMLARLALGLDLGRARQSMVLGLDEEAGSRGRPLVPALLLALSAAYAALIGFRLTPFLVATALYVFAAALLLSGLSRRRVVGAALVAAAAAAATDVVFRRLFGLDLP